MYEAVKSVEAVFVVSNQAIANGDNIIAKLTAEDKIAQGMTNEQKETVLRTPSDGQ